MKMRIRRIVKKEHGFTIIELAIVLLIFGILLSFSVAGGAAWLSRGMLIRQNQGAQSLYYAMQTGLSYYMSSGVLEEKMQEMGLHEEDLAFISLNGGLLPEENNHIEAETQIKEMLSLYVSEESLLKHPAVIVFEPSTGRVAGVYYTDFYMGFSRKIHGVEKIDGGEYAGIGDGTGESNSYLKKNRIGYYGDINEQD